MRTSTAVSSPSLAFSARGRVDAIVAFLIKHQRRLECAEKLTIIFHCGLSDVSVEVVEKQQVAVLAT